MGSPSLNAWALGPSSIVVSATPMPKSALTRFLQTCVDSSSIMRCIRNSCSGCRISCVPLPVHHDLSYILVLAAAVLAITPGPGIAYVVARTVSGGRKEGLASCLGTGVGGMVHVLAAALGLSLVIAQSATAFNLVKYIGAAYLVYLGIRMLMRKDSGYALQEAASQGSRKAFLEGIVVEMLNVKTALFLWHSCPSSCHLPRPSCRSL